MSSAVTKRLQKEFLLVRKATFEACPPFFATLEGGSLFSWLVLIIGPPGTPYHGGFFIFRFEFADKGNTYPFVPPTVKILTTDGGTVRMNPNLYANGKVCLSILGTFGKREWSPAMNVIHVIHSIQGLVMTEQPYYNEPGFERGATAKQQREPPSREVAEYCQKISHEVLRVAVLGNVELVLNEILREPSSSLSSSGAAKIVMPFANEILNLFQLWQDMYKGLPHVQKGLASRCDKQPFVVTEFEFPGNEARGFFMYAELMGRVCKASARLADFVSAKSLIHLDSSSLHIAAAAAGDSSTLPCSIERTHKYRWVLRFHDLPQEYCCGVTTRKVEVLYLAIRDENDGDNESDDGVEDPRLRTRPLVRLLLPMWHPHVALEGNGVYWFAAEGAWPEEGRYSINHVAGHVHQVLSNPPSAGECTWLNIVAAKEFFANKETFRQHALLHAQQQGLAANCDGGVEGAAPPGKKHRTEDTRK